MVYRLIVSYRGEGFSGWQRQPSTVTVQGTLEEALARIVGAPVAVVGAGRTDTGVHARGQVAHLILPGEIETRALVHGTNHHLPDSVRVLDAARVRDGFHARKSALGKEYRYQMNRVEVLSPLDAPRMLRIREVDLEAMRAASATLVGRHDFTAFALAGGAHRQPWRTMKQVEWIERGSRLEFRIAGDAFLRGMVRSLVGTLLEVGSDRRSVAEFEALLQGRPREEAGPTAPAQGLTLEAVFYAADWLLLPD